MKNKRQSGSIYIILGIISAVLICGALGFIVWQNFITPKDATTTSNKTVKPTQATTPTNQEVSKETNNWNVFSNTNYGFKFKYPTELIDVTEKANKSSLKVITAFDINPDYTTFYPLIRINSFSSTLSAKDYASTATVGETSKQKDLNLASGTAYEQINNLNGIQLKNVFFANKKNIITFTMLVSSDSSVSNNKIIDNSAYVTKFDVMVDSFKFTD